MRSEAPTWEKEDRVGREWTEEQRGANLAERGPKVNQTDVRSINLVEGGQGGRELTVAQRVGVGEPTWQSVDQSQPKSTQVLRVTK